MIAAHARLVALPHTVLALPFAVGAAALASRSRVLLSTRQLLWIAVAVAALRTSAMAWNRLVDARFDALNPRTRAREIPRGAVSPSSALGLVVASAALFVLAAAMLGRVPLVLSPLAIVLALGYSLAKRFTWATHFWLGAVLGGAPLGAWIAITNSVNAAALILWLAVACWVAGFDVIYACQDAAFDRANGLSSLPARFGVEPALRCAALLHVAATISLIAVGMMMRLGFVYYIGITGIALALAATRRSAAFFTLNGVVSLLFAAATLVEALR